MIFPGQVERVDFTFEQVECLTSPVRSAVFWAFTSHTPQSVADVAKGLGKSAQTVHYHVNGLLEVGLLVAVDTRQRGARTETLY
ncbi:ArsR family transcriptional regulator, partial [bacterium]